MSEWQPIETAPKDGTVVLLYKPLKQHHASDGWEEGARPGQMLTIWQAQWASYWADPSDLAKVLDDPTHWMPLPSPPDLDRKD